MSRSNEVALLLNAMEFNSMEKVTVEQCKQAIKDLNTNWVSHHRCGICGSMVGYVFQPASNVYVDPSLEGLKPDDTIVGFDPRCDCTSRGAVDFSSWDRFANEFNMQTPEVRKKMWARFKAGGATHEGD